MPIVNVTLEEILRARDTRAASQRRLLNAYHLPLVSFTMNIAGPVKRTPLIELPFDAGLKELQAVLGQPIAAEVSFDIRTYRLMPATIPLLTSLSAVRPCATLTNILSASWLPCCRET